MSPRDRLRANIRRKARRVLRTYVGQHWPDARTLNYNGTGIDFGEPEPGGAAVRAYLAACNPEVILDALSDSPEKTT